MSSMYQNIDYFVRKALSFSRNIAICPMGECGLLTKQILNWRYGIDEKFILDNYMKEFNPSIIGIDELKEEDVENLVVILASANKEINVVLQKQIRLVNQNIVIINILDPMIFDEDDHYEYIEKMRRLLTIKGIEGHRLIRVGKDYDGGYIMLNDFSEDMHAYSFGIADDVSWDVHIASFGLKVFMYDHTIEHLPQNVTGGEFFPIGIGGIDNINAGTLSMKTILEKNGDIESNNLILKMDVEGAEWDFLLETPSDILDHFVQLTFEFHFLFEKDKKELILTALDKIDRTHQVVWVHGNNAGNAYTFHGMILPEIIEATFVNRKKYKFFSHDIYNIPTELDMPNLPEKYDFKMGDFSGSVL